jgi:hypothetical protein
MIKKSSIGILITLNKIDCDYQPLHSCSSFNSLEAICHNDSFVDSQVVGSPAATPVLTPPDSGKPEGELEQSMIDLIENETAIWSTLRHPNIIQLINVLEVEDFVFVVSACSKSIDF